MPLGASLTQGYASTNQNGYRRRLYLSLKRDGYSVNFVGSQQSGLPDFDVDHEGHPGWHAEGGSEGGIALFVYDWLVANPTDVVLLHVGTNDISVGGQDPAEIAHILDEIDRFSTDTTVVLALIINRKTYSPATTQFNLDVQTMAQNRIASGDKIVIVDMEHALTYPDDMADNLHPNDVGYFKIATVWLNALEGFMPRCR
jgi:lysophospholipase L1-like esterase